ncbi:MAG: hypothetical protein ABEJ73_03420 [Haloplanus sp.]
MPAQAPLHSLPSPTERVASVVDWLAVLAGPLGSVALLGGRGPLPEVLGRARSLVTLGRVVLVQPVALATLLLALSALAAYALWTHRRWLVWTLAGIAGVVTLVGAPAGGVAFAPLAGLLTVAAGLRSRRANRTSSDQPDVTL